MLQKIIEDFDRGKLIQLPIWIGLRFLWTLFGRIEKKSECNIGKRATQKHNKKPDLKRLWILNEALIEWLFNYLW